MSDKSKTKTHKHKKSSSAPVTPLSMKAEMITIARIGDILQPFDNETQKRILHAAIIMLGHV